MVYIQYSNPTKSRMRWWLSGAVDAVEDVRVDEWWGRDQAKQERTREQNKQTNKQTNEEGEESDKNARGFSFPVCLPCCLLALDESGGNNGGCGQS